eukprot:15980001-Heterocapsa_arctica.AAC.1
MDHNENWHKLVISVTLPDKLQCPTGNQLMQRWVPSTRAAAQLKDLQLFCEALQRCSPAAPLHPSPKQPCQ